MHAVIEHIKNIVDSLWVIVFHFYTIITTIACFISAYLPPKDESKILTYLDKYVNIDKIVAAINLLALNVKHAKNAKK